MFFLLSAEKHGWPLKKFVILRLQVGHTHILLDAAWGLLSRYVYGILSRGDPRRDILNWDQLEEVCRMCFKDRLMCFEHIKGCYDFDEHVKGLGQPYSDVKGWWVRGVGRGQTDNSRGASTRLLCDWVSGLRKHFSIELTVEDGKIFARSKPDMNASTPWSAPAQMFPPPMKPNAQPPPPSAVPPTAELKEWPLADLVQRDLVKFYSQSMRYTTTEIPEHVRDGKMCPK